MGDHCKLMKISMTILVNFAILLKPLFIHLQVFHICQADGRQNSFLCPVGTMFNQKSFTCDWWFNVICSEASMFYARNENLYKSPYIGIDGMKVSSYHGQSGPQSTGSDIQPAVGIPNADSKSKGANWPPRQQNPSEGNWRTNQRGSQRGDTRPTGQRGMRRRQNWQDGVNIRQERGQKGSRRRQNTNQQQHGNFQNQKGWTSQVQMGTNRNWNQRSDVNIGSRNVQGLNQPRGGNQGQHRGHTGFQEIDRNAGSGETRVGINIGENTNKGFDTNTWSIRAQNFRISSHDRKSSSSDVWVNNNEPVDGGHDRDAYVPPQTWQSQATDAKDMVNEEYSEQGSQKKGSDDAGGEWDEHSANGNEDNLWRNSYETDYDYS